MHKEKNGNRLHPFPAASSATQQHPPQQLLPPPPVERPVRVRGEGERPHFYTARELAQILRVTENTIYRLARRGELPSFSIGRSIRFRTQDVEAFLERVRTIC